MRLYIVRHADPDYEHDSLTETGWKEAKALVPRFTGMDIKNFYVSPLGRARDTASLTLQAMNRTAEVCDWLREFPAKMNMKNYPELQAAYPDTKYDKDGNSERIVWDMLPFYLSEHPEYLDRHLWRESLAAVNSDMIECYDRVIREFDSLLAKHGYERRQNYYYAEKANRDTLVFFCHFGLECVLLSHLLNVSPFALWSGTVFAPSSVSLIRTEERQEHIAYFRAAQLGDVSHLYAAGYEPSFAARFCETFDSMDERH
ncbi:MAG: histidine phosphatase family protein [Eubacteriales bacterium]|nr:histidine phosphatase family protein [Eubacteriales bacterium]